MSMKSSEVTLTHNRLQAPIATRNNEAVSKGHTSNSSFDCVAVPDELLNTEPSLSPGIPPTQRESMSSRVNASATINRKYTPIP